MAGRPFMGVVTLVSLVFVAFRVGLLMGKQSSIASGPTWWSITAWRSIAQCPAAAGLAITADQLGRAPSFPVRCRSDLAEFAAQLSSMTVPATATSSRGLVKGAAQPAPPAPVGGPPAPAPLEADEAWFGATQTLDASAPQQQLSASTGNAFDWLHFDAGLRTAAELSGALESWYPTLKAGGLMSGSNFLDASDPRHPLVSTGGFTKEKQILFIHAEDASYRTRLEGTGHAVRSSVKAFALKHKLQLFVTCKSSVERASPRNCFSDIASSDMYDCHDEPTWYMLKPNDKPLSPRAPVERHTIGRAPAACKGYEKSVGGTAAATAVQGCAFAEAMQASAARINAANTFPVRCRDDLALLANDLGLTGKAAEVGTWAGTYSAKNLRAWQGDKYYMVDRWAPQKGDLPGCKAGSAACKDKNFPAAEMTQAMEQARNATAEFGDRRELIKGISTEVAPRFEDNTLDWIYIDALHTGEALLEDLGAWFPKLRSGGVISGDDFADLCDSRRALDNSKILLQGFEKTGYKSRPVRGGYGVRWGVKEFFSSRNVPFFVTYMNDCYAEAAWYAIKP